MEPKFYKRLEKEIEEWEKKYPGRKYSPEQEKLNEETRTRWAKK